MPSFVITPLALKLQITPDPRPALQLSSSPALHPAAALQRWPQLSSPSASSYKVTGLVGVFKYEGGLESGGKDNTKQTNELLLRAL